MPGFFRKGGAKPDVSPPREGAAPKGERRALGPCARCGQPVMPADAREFVAGAIEHVVCDAALRDVVGRRIEASRAAHRALEALAAMPRVVEVVRAELGRMPDAIDVPDAIALLDRAEVAVQCEGDLDPQRRRLALSWLRAVRRKLAADRPAT